mgnify:CR=1 FL=1
MIHKTNIFAAPIIWGAALALALAAGCDKMATTESPTGFPEDGVVRIAANAGDPLTRADGASSSEYSGTTLGLFIYYGTNDKYNGSNVKWTKAENAWTPEKQMLWKDDKTGANIYAYAPYVDGSAADAVNFEIPSDQTAGTLAADLVSWAYLGFVPNDSNNDFQDGKILISFGHRLVKLTFNFEKGNQFASDVTVSEAVLLGTSSKVVLNATKGTVAAATDAAGLNIKLHKVEDAQNPTALKYEAVFFPGEGQGAGAKMLQVKMSDGTILNYVVPSSGLVSGGLKAGSAYEMKMRLGKDKIEVASDVTVADWTEGGTTLPGGESVLNADVWDGTVATGFASGSGISDDPYLISTSAQLAYLARQVNGGTSYEGKYFRQTANFDLAGKKWTPIGNSSNEFKGHFDGDNKEVYDLNVDITGSYAGLFGNITNGSVKNVRICSGSVKASVYYVGGIVGDFNYSTMENCTASVNVSGNSNVGGLAGSISGSTVSNCHFLSGEIVGSGDGPWDGDAVGGIVGRVQSSNVSTVKDCSANASVKGRMNVGGLCGWFGNGDHEFSNCTMKGSVTVTKEWCGGLVGYLSSSNGKFENCQFEGSIKKDGDNVSNTGIAIGADASNVTFKNCVCTIDEQTKTDLGKDNKVGSSSRSSDVYSGITVK